LKSIIFFSWQHLWSMKNKAGAPSYHHTLMHYIDSSEWEVYLFTTDESNLELDNYNNCKVFLFKDNKLNELLCSTHLINHMFLPIKHKKYSRWAVKKASQLIETLGPDVLVYGYEVWGCEAAEKVSKKHKIPLITRFQGTILSYEKHNFLNRMIHYPHYGALETKADLVIMTDDGTKGDVTLKELGNNSETIFLRNGLDLYEKYKDIHRDIDKSSVRKELKIDEHEYILLMASRLTSWKRVDRGIKALKIVIDKISNIKLIIAGDGDSRMFLEQLTKDYHLENKVQFLGSIPQSELYKYMICSDIFMSLYDLGNLGNPTFEAMLMKNAIIALNGGSTSSVLHDGENAILLEYEEEDKIPEAIEKLLLDESYRNRLEENAFKYAVDNFYSWKTRMKIEEERIKTLL